MILKTSSSTKTGGIDAKTFIAYILNSHIIKKWMKYMQYSLK